jgi:hypothetical protein
MKTRIIHTRFWKDNFISTLTAKEKLVFIYLLTNENVSLSGIYELPDKYVQADLDLNPSELKTIKEKLQKNSKFYFIDGWVKIVNHDKYNCYTGAKTGMAREKEIASVPSKVMEYGSTIDTSIDTSMDTPNNHKSEIINNKPYKNINYLLSIPSEDFEELKKDLDVSDEQIKSKGEDLHNYCLAKGRVYKDYKAFLRNSLKRDYPKKNYNFI